MQIIDTFESSNEDNGRLLTVKYPDQDLDEFRRLYSIWNDVEYLFNFFNQYEQHLRKGFPGISTDQAIELTQAAVDNMFETILFHAQAAHLNLDQLFKPLNNSEYHVVELQKTKVKINPSKNWLRIYGIRIDPNTIIITGGAIKLTRTMDESEHTKAEKVKLGKVQAYLRENGVQFIEDIEDLIS